LKPQDGKSPLTNASIFSLKNCNDLENKQKLQKLKFPKDLQTATHRFDSKGRANFVLAPREIDSSALVSDSNVVSALLPLDSAIPKLNPDRLNKKIQKYKLHAEKVKNYQNL